MFLVCRIGNLYLSKLLQPFMKKNIHNKKQGFVTELVTRANNRTVNPTSSFYALSAIQIFIW